MQHDPNLEEMAARLQASGDFRILRRLIPRPVSTERIDPTDRVGVILDLETTGLDWAKDEVIELGMVRFTYSAADEITAVTGTFQGFNEPSAPIPSEITELTGITDEMVAGQRIEGASVAEFVRAANVVIAHNAGFDRQFAERFWPLFGQKHWACSMAKVDWRKHGFAGARLGYLLAGCGLFHDAHRAVDDCHAVLEILSKPLPGTPNSALAALLARARKPSFRIWAENSPYESKDVLKARGYRWANGAAGSKRCWYIDLGQDEHQSELEFLRAEIYQREVDIPARPMTVLERFSARI